MAGKIKRYIDKIVSERSNGDDLLKEMTKTKLIMKGINPSKYSETSEDDPSVEAKLEAIAKEFNIKL